MSGTQRVLKFGDKKITLIGTAHVSKESVEEVKNTINELHPDCVAVELDDKRAASIEDKEGYSKLDIIAVLKRKEGFLLLANLVLASFQRRMGQNVDVKPGDEMLAAMECAKEKSIPVVMADRPIQTTLKRAWAKSSFWGKCKLFSSLCASAFTNEEISEEEIEAIKEKNEMDSMMNELADYLPVVKEVLIDERNTYLATKIWEAEGKNIVAVLGAGHLDGVVENLESLSKNENKVNLEEISSIPPKTAFGKIAPWIIPAIIVGLIVAGFIYGGSKMGTDMIKSWFLKNGVPAAVMSLLALAHPVTIIAAFFSAPFTSLCPFVGVGFVTGIIQAFLCKPRVKDMETLQDDVTFTGFYRNRILRVLLVFILSSLGSTVGTFVGWGDIVNILVTGPAA